MRSVENLVNALGREISFFVVTLAWDLGARYRYDLKPGLGWRRVGFARARYFSRSPRELWRFVRVLGKKSWDIVYVNSVFDRQFGMLPMLMKRLGLLRCERIIVAPRGEFSKGALRFKPWRKRIYCAVARAGGLYHGVTWQASTEHEAADIVRQGFGGVALSNVDKAVAPVAGNIVVAADLARMGSREPAARRRKESGSLECVFVSRIARKKNLAQCAEILRSVAGKVRFRIAGPIEDRSYWNECVGKLTALPKNVSWEYLGEAPPAEVSRFFEESHLFMFPTFGENFGHVIAEALASGCPVLTTDQVPWLDLENAGAGWALSVDDVRGFKRAVEVMIGLDAASFRRMSRAAESYIRNHRNITEGIRANRRLFALKQGRAEP